MKYSTTAILVTALCLIVIAIVCGLGVSSMINRADPGPATTPSGQFTQWSPDQ